MAGYFAWRGHVSHVFADFFVGLEWCLVGVWETHRRSPDAIVCCWRSWAGGSGGLDEFEVFGGFGSWLGHFARCFLYQTGLQELNCSLGGK